MKWHLVTYADQNYKKKQDFITNIHKENFIIHSYGREWLESSELYDQNKDILDDPKGAGWWIWKPYAILDAFEKSEDGDFVIYCDCGDMFSPQIKKYVIDILYDDICLLLVGNNINRQYTKRDCFIIMDCDDEDYWNCKQLESGFMIWRVCDKSIEVLQKWLHYCLNYDIISNSQSKLGEEFSDFKEHRNDQSILTNIAVTDGLSVGDQEYRNYIECDYDYWYERNEKYGFNLGREIDSFLLNIKNA